MMRHAAFAKEIARDDYEIDLDFSESSLAPVKEILAKLYAVINPNDRRRRPSRGGPTAEQLKAVAIVWGAYVGEVIRRRWGGGGLRTSKPGTQSPFT